MSTSVWAGSGTRDGGRGTHWVSLLGGEDRAVKSYANPYVAGVGLGLREGDDRDVPRHSSSLYVS